MRSQRHPIRTREIADDGGHFTATANVYCPSHERAIDLAACDDCPRCDAIHLDPTARDSFVLCQAPARRAPDGARLADVMARDVLGVTPSLTLFELEALLLQRGFSGAPVVDGDGFPVGVVSKTDLVRARFERRDAGACVADVMTPCAFTLEETAPVEQAAALMAVEGVHRLPVVDADGRVVGLLSPLDVLRWVARRAGYVR